MVYADISQALKDIAAAGKKIHDQDINSKIIDLQGMVMDLMIENQELKQQLLKGNDIEARKTSLKKFGIFWVKDQETLDKLKNLKAPYPDELTANIYCPSCLARKDKFISVYNIKLYNNVWYLACPSCDDSHVPHPY